MEVTATILSGNDFLSPFFKSAEDTNGETSPRNMDEFLSDELCKEKLSRKTFEPNPTRPEYLCQERHSCTTKEILRPRPIHGPMLKSGEDSKVSSLCRCFSMNTNIHLTSFHLPLTHLPKMVDRMGYVPRLPKASFCGRCSSSVNRCCFD